MAAIFTLCLVACVGEANAQIPVSSCGPITDTGSYLLTNNLTTSGDCLVVAAGVPNVTLDLNGFTMFGDGTGSALRSDGTLEGLVVRNGTIKNFEGALRLNGNTILIERVTVIRNTGIGLFANESVKVNDSVFVGNNVGLIVGEGSLLVGNIVSFNISDGIVTTGVGGTLINNTSRRNGGIGILVSCPSNIVENTATGNTDVNLVLNGAGCNSNNNVAP